MLTVVLKKYLNCAVNKTTNTGHTTNINYTLILSKYNTIQCNINNDINY